MAVQQHLESILECLRASSGLPDASLLSSDLHVWPDFHGNRAPLADPNMRGAICGLGLEKGPEQLAMLYLAATQALAYGTRHIVDEMKRYLFREGDIWANSGSYNWTKLLFIYLG